MAEPVIKHKRRDTWMKKANNQNAVENNHTSQILYGSETTKALNNFTISELTMPRAFLSALGMLKGACAKANCELGLLDEERANAIILAAKEVADGAHDNREPVLI